MKNKYLQVEQYPYAILKFGEGQSGKGQGELEIGGITRPVQGEYRINGGQLEASFKIKLSDYRISGIRYMGVGVKDEARIEVRLPIKK
jgi:polyisoprenoid-binding protein YceI